MLNTYKKGASMLCTKGAKPALLSSVSEVLLLRISGIFFSWRCSYMPCAIYRFSCSIGRELWVVFTHFISLAPALHFRTSCQAFCFLFSGTSSWSISDSQLVLAPGSLWRNWRMGDGKRNKVKKSIWQLLCGCSSPQTTDWMHHRSMFWASQIIRLSEAV